jgi:hypothetical protein
LKKIHKITIIITTILLIGCNNKYEKKLIGTWFSLQENEKLQFDTDSLFVNDISKIGTWNADKNSINYNWSLYPQDSIKKTTLKYKLNSFDSLVLNSKNNKNEKYTFLKSDNFLNFLFKKNNIHINLEKNSKAKFQDKTENKYSIKIFAGYNNDSIIVKSEYSKNLENLEYDLRKILEDVNPYFTNEYNNFNESFKEKINFNRWIKIKIHYLLFIDKSIPNNLIENIVEKLRKSEIKNIYRAYMTEESKYIDFYNIKEIKL